MTGRGRGPDDGPQPIARSLDRLLGAMNAPSVDVVAAVFGSWPEIVGADLASHARPVAVDGDRLVVKVDDPAWASEFRWLEREVIARIAEVAGSDRIKALSIGVERRGAEGSRW